MDTMKKKELLLYAVVWGLIFALVPLMMLLQDHSTSWPDVLSAWGTILPYFILFVCHNMLAAPFLQKKQYLLYGLITLGLLVLFALYAIRGGLRPSDVGNLPPFNPFDNNPRPAPPDGLRPTRPEVMEIVMGILVLAVNLGAKFLFQSLRNAQKVQELRAESLNRQLETLRYQINPHFFMNTLNNIHALVDIDPEKAKESIEEFSKLMRIVLYDNNAPTIPLQREMDFLSHYVSLMRLRYPESVRIDLSLPDGLEGAEVPPLLLASFVENAFKHGISYDSPSFVRVLVSLQDRKILFKCTNSRHPVRDNQPHGLGLDNVRERLDLLYENSYTLQVEELPELFDVLLVIPERKAVV